MNCDGAFSITSAPVGACLSTRIRGELAIGTHLRAADSYAVGSFDPDHDAVMRIGVGLQPTGLTRGEAPGGGSILSVGLKCHVRIRLPAPSDRQFGSHAVKASANAKWCLVLCSFR